MPITLTPNFGTNPALAPSFLPLTGLGLPSKPCTPLSISSSTFLSARTRSEWVVRPRGMCEPGESGSGTAVAVVVVMFAVEGEWEWESGEGEVTRLCERERDVDLGGVI